MVKCEDCKKSKATIDYSSEPMLSLTHGWGIIKLCKSCFINRIKEHIKDCEKQIKDLEDGLSVKEKKNG